MNKIIVIGYPKSGNTWITRLTAELVGCPAKGYLYSDHPEMAAEGSNRVSSFAVFKSHHQYQELNQDDQHSSFLIYVTRDPRDISISGRNYFSPKQLLNFNWSSKNKISKILTLLKSKINHVYIKIFGKALMKRGMNKAVLKGNEKVHYWCRVSWKTHLIPYLKNPQVLKVNYESALSNPLKESKKILAFIGLEKNDFEIQQAINNQSFKKKKEKFLAEEQFYKASFLRKGKSEQWKTEFSKKENKIYVKKFKKELIKLGYDLGEF